MKLAQDFGVRALLATLIVAPGIGVLVYLSVIGNREALIALVSIISAVVGYYYGQRTA